MASKHYLSLRDLLRHASYRPFQATHRTNRQAHILGMGPNGTMIGWWLGGRDLVEWDADEIDWDKPSRFL
jgi:hypothetical protein